MLEKEDYCEYGDLPTKREIAQWEEESMKWKQSQLYHNLAGTPRNLNFYFRDDHVGVIKDFKKLDNLDIKNKWLLAFIYPSPTPEIWRQALQLLPNEIKHWNCVSAPVSGPDCLFIALWTPISN